MTATTHERNTRFAGLAPSIGDFPVAANTLLIRNTLVCLNASGQLVPGVDGEGFHAIGRVQSTFDNRTTAPEGGAAGAIWGTVDYGVFDWVIDGSTPVPGNVVYVVDNQTVSLDSSGGTRGIAGYVSRVEGTKIFVHMGPTVVAQALQIASIVVDATSAQAFIPIPITSWRDGGGPLAAFVDGSVNGTQLVDSEALGFRFGPVGEDTTVLSTSVAMPPDLDDAHDVVLHVLAFRVGSADTTTVLVGSAFFQTVGAAHTADADAITVDSAALDAATTIVGEYTLTIAAADVPAAPCALTLTLAPSAALDADDLVVVGTWLEYTRALRAS